MEAWVAIAGLVGTVVGSLISWAAMSARDRAAFRTRWDQARFEAYADFLAATYEAYNVAENYVPLTRRTNAFTAFALVRTGVLGRIQNAQKLVIDGQARVLLLGSPEAIAASHEFLAVLEEATTLAQQSDRDTTSAKRVREALARARQRFVATIRGELAVPDVDVLTAVEVAPAVGSPSGLQASAQSRSQVPEAAA